ncbi:MAG: hypothetical protein EAZ47_07480 [Bacteroidetes bacterium]|nr:MAG: hypothetical protein EAY72_09460 [Bacteroidota bacterium]TAE72187.1 MAG: hypothetical protein EAY68_01355 [Bacteroidota bacterium]TAF93094.1 MAG: hypothetical protein EAZ47_07480 [Bacteroidota bacterium]
MLKNLFSAIVVTSLFCIVNTANSQKATYRLTKTDSIYYVYTDSLYDYKEWLLYSSDGKGFPFSASVVQRTNLITLELDTFYVIGESLVYNFPNIKHKILYTYQSPDDHGVIAIFNTQWQREAAWQYGKISLKNFVAFNLISGVTKSQNYIVTVQPSNQYKTDAIPCAYQKYNNAFFRMPPSADMRPHSLNRVFLSSLGVNP